MSKAARKAGVPCAARITATVQLSVHHVEESGAVLRFTSPTSVMSLWIAREVFPRLVDLFQFAALSPAPPIPVGILPPHECRPVRAQW